MPNVEGTLSKKPNGQGIAAGPLVLTTVIRSSKSPRYRGMSSGSDFLVRLLALRAINSAKLLAQSSSYYAAEGLIGDRSDFNGP